MDNEKIVTALYRIFPGLSGCKYLYNWVIDAAIESYSHQYQVEFTADETTEVRNRLVEGLKAIGFQENARSTV